MKKSKAKEARRSSFVPAAVTALLLLFYGGFLAHRISLHTADLGRHLKNGEVFFRTFDTISTNYYSYTWPDHPSINHHWGSGVLFHTVWIATGFIGLHLFFITLSLATFLLMFLFVRRRFGLGPASLAALFFIPLLAERTEIRPEVFSYAFAALFYVLAWRFLEGKLGTGQLVCLPLLEILWVNLHIYFFLGPLILAAFAGHAFIRRAYDPGKFPALAATSAGTLVATLVNPSFLSGALVPLTIFRDYGFAITENQPVWVVERIFRNPNFFIFKASLVLLILSFVLAARGRKSVSPADAILALGVSLMALAQVRNFTLFGLFAFSVVARNIERAFGEELAARAGALRTAAVTGAAVVCLVAFSANLPSLYPYWNEFGLGLETGNSRAAEFLRSSNIQGPILNNYDIGGYLIFHLFPDRRVFVDNRPEAYPSEFFRDDYLPLLDNDQRWREALARYNFNVIVLSPRDASTPGRKFFFARFYDPEWAPVYGDANTMVFARRNSANQGIIQAYEIPREMFRFVNR